MYAETTWITCSIGAVGDGVPASRGRPPALALMAHAPPVQREPGQVAFLLALSGCQSCLYKDTDVCAQR